MDLLEDLWVKCAQVAIAKADLSHELTSFDRFRLNDVFEFQFTEHTGSVGTLVLWDEERYYTSFGWIRDNWRSYGPFDTYAWEEIPNDQVLMKMRLYL